MRKEIGLLKILDWGRLFYFLTLAKKEIIGLIKKLDWGKYCICPHKLYNQKLKNIQ